MNNKRTSVFENGLIWFGAAVSLAEILTGTYLAPLGFAKGISAIIAGHIIGCALLFLAGLIGGTVRKSSMETSKMSFGQKGSMFFAFLNVLQLVGWTAIMIYDGAIAANGIFNIGEWAWTLIIGLLITLWILVGIKSLGKINTISMISLFVLTIVLSFVIFKNHSHPVTYGEALSFGAAVELSVAMPLSWLPLISDYTREAKNPIKATAVSAITYGLVSSWMYIIGMGAAIFTETSDIAQIMIKAGLGTLGLIIIVLSTVTTTFLDAYSAGVSSETLIAKINGKWIAVATTIIGTIAAILFPLENITEFLYLIGSVFAPMIAIIITDFFILKKDYSDTGINIRNTIIWAVGFITYRILMKFDIIIGNTLPDMIITVIICISVYLICNRGTYNENNIHIEPEGREQ